MTNEKKILLLVLMILAAASVSAVIYLESLKPDNLEEFTDRNQEAADMIESFCETSYDGSRMTADIKGNSITYMYKYDEDIEKDIEEQLENQFDVYADSMSEAYDRVIESLEKQSGFDDISIILVFADNEGNEMYKKVFGGK